MSILIAILLGIIQGLCEFLPVSSSGHLVLAQMLFGVEQGSLSFDIMLHIGTLVAVLIVYRKQIFELLKHPLQKKVLMLIIATIVTAVFGLVFKKVFPDVLEGSILGIGFILTSILLFAGEKFSTQKRSTDDMKIHHAIIAGAFQGFAVMPGLSRSGSTISSMTLMGFNREDAADFSFLLSIPAILGSMVLDIFDGGLANIEVLPTLIGMVVAGVSGYFAIKFMLMLVKNKKLVYFAIYTLILGIVVIMIQLFAPNVLSQNKITEEMIEQQMLINDATAHQNRAINSKLDELLSEQKISQQDYDEVIDAVKPKSFDKEQAISQLEELLKIAAEAKRQGITVTEDEAIEFVTKTYSQRVEVVESEDLKDNPDAIAIGAGLDEFVKYLKSQGLTVYGYAEKTKDVNALNAYEYKLRDKVRLEYKGDDWQNEWERVRNEIIGK